jgi:hypothetical protein
MSEKLKKQLEEILERSFTIKTDIYESVQSVIFDPENKITKDDCGNMIITSLNGKSVKILIGG